MTPDEAKSLIDEYGQLKREQGYAASGVTASMDAASEAKLLAAYEKLNAALIESKWQSGDPPQPEKTEWFSVRVIELWRWLPYKPDGARQMKAKGRWQKHNEHGFENADWPEGAEWIRIERGATGK